MQVQLYCDTTKYKCKPNNLRAIRGRIASSSPQDFSPIGIKFAIENGMTIMPAVVKPSRNDNGNLTHKSENFENQRLFGVDIDNAHENEPMIDADGNPVLKENGKPKMRKLTPDEGYITPAQAIEICKLYGIKPFFMYHTFSSTTDFEKFRIFVILDELVTDNKERYNIVAAFISLFGRAADTACTDAVRVFHGGKPECSIYFEQDATTPKSVFLDIWQTMQEIEADAKQEVQRASNSLNAYENAKNHGYDADPTVLLNMMNPNALNRAEWMKVSAAYKNSNGDYAQWSAWCSQYTNDDPKEDAKLWETVGKAGQYGKAGIGTLKRAANQYASSEYETYIADLTKKQRKMRKSTAHADTTHRTLSSDVLADFHTADTFQTEPVNWLWKGRIPKGYITFLMSPGGCGKSFLSCSIAAAASTGRALIDGEETTPGKVLYISCEDSGAIIRERLEKCDANLKNIMIQDLDANHPLLFPNTVEDTETMERWNTLMSKTKPVLVICDVWHGLCNPDTDLNRQNSVRGILRAVAHIAKEHGTAFLLLAHTNKNKQITNLNDAMMGSSDAVNAARSVLAVLVNSETAERVLVHSKSNLAALQRSIEFSVDGNGLTFGGFSPITKAVYESAMQNHRTAWQEVERQERKEIDTSALFDTLADLAQLGKTITVTYDELTEAAGYDIFAGNQPQKILKNLKRDDLLSRGLSISDIGKAFQRGDRKKRGFKLSSNTTTEEMAKALPR